jgi:hypothetical protein
MVPTLGLGWFVLFDSWAQAEKLRLANATIQIFLSFFHISIEIKKQPYN